MSLRILLVEDNESDVKITLRAFRQASPNTDITVVGDGQECLDFVRHEGAYSDGQKYLRPQVILLDINMPRCDGFEVLRVLKGDDATRAIPIVMFSASRNEGDVVKSYQYGANGFIQKPVDYEVFLKAVEQFNHYWQNLNRLPEA